MDIYKSSRIERTGYQLSKEEVENLPIDEQEKRKSLMRETRDEIRRINFLDE